MFVVTDADVTEVYWSWQTYLNKTHRTLHTLDADPNSLKPQLGVPSTQAESADASSSNCRS